MGAVRLLKPALEELPQYKAALERGWSHDNIGGRATAEKELVAIAKDPAAFVASLDDPQGKGPPVEQPDGTFARRLPGYRRWIWDGEFCGSIGLRWQPGTTDLPAHVFGHIGYAVVPWKRGQGCATRGLGLLLPDARALGLAHVELTTDEDNVASRRVIEANGGLFVENFRLPGVHGGDRKVRYRIPL